MDPVTGSEIDIEFGESDSVPTVAIIAVTLTAEELQPAMLDVLGGGTNRFVLDLGGVGDVEPDVFDYLARFRASLTAEGGDVALVTTPSDREELRRLGYESAIPVFDGTHYAASYLRGSP